MSVVFLRQSTASQEVQIGKFVDDTDFKTAETALSIANTDVKLHKHGATSQVSKNSGGGTHIANGWYYLVFDATDSDTVGNMMVTVDVSGALSVCVRCVVLDEAVYDVLFGTAAPATATTNEIADAVLSRNASNVEASAGEHTLCTVILAMLEHSISGTTMTIKRTDGTTTHATKTLTASAGADPITGVS